MSTLLKTDDVKLASYLSLLGYGDPAYELEGRKIKYIFNFVEQKDILAYYNREPILVSPLALFEKQYELSVNGKTVYLHLDTTVFGPSA